jgi:hypothetical protein
VFGSIAWAHIFNEKRIALKPECEECIFVGYFEHVKGYIILQPHSNEIFIRRNVKFDGNISSYETNSMFVPYLACKPYLTFCHLMVLL